MFKQFFKKHLKKYIIFATIFVVLFITAIFSSSINNFVIRHLEKDKQIVYKGDKLLVHILSVGEADACVIQFPNGENCIIDCGTIYTASSVVDYINDNILNHSKTKVINYLFFTHADDDHTGGIEAIVNNFDVKNIIRPRQYSEAEGIYDRYGTIVDSDIYTRTINAIYKEKELGANLIKAEDGLVFYIGKAKLEIFYPLAKYKESNDYSYFIKLSYNNKSMLFTGDALFESEEELLKIHKDDIKCDILKVSHHGGDNASSYKFLQAVNAEYALISVGANRLGHPAEVVLDKLNDLNCKVYRTDVHGSFVIALDKDIKFYLGKYIFSPIKISYKIFVILVIMVLLLCVIIDLFKLIILTVNKKKLTKLLK